MVVLFILLFSLTSWSNQSRHFIIDLSNDLKISQEHLSKIFCNMKNVVTTNGEDKSLIDKISEFNNTVKSDFKIKNPILKLYNKSALELYDGYEELQKYNTVIQLNIASGLDLIGSETSFLTKLIKDNLINNFSQVPVILNFLEYTENISFCCALLSEYKYAQQAPFKLILNSKESVFRNYRSIGQEISNFGLNSQYFFIFKIRENEAAEDTYFELGKIFKEFKTSFAIDVSNNKIDEPDLECLIKKIINNDNLYKLNITDNAPADKSFIDKLYLTPEKLSKIIWRKELHELIDDSFKKHAAGTFNGKVKLKEEKNEDQKVEESPTTVSEEELTDTLNDHLSIESDEEDISLELDKDFVNSKNPFASPAHSYRFTYDAYNKSFDIYFYDAKVYEDYLCNKKNKSAFVHTISHAIEAIEYYRKAYADKVKKISSMHINLSTNMIRNEGAKVLADYCDTVKIPCYLNLSNNKIQLEGLKALANISLLEELIFIGNYVNKKQAESDLKLDQKAINKIKWE